AHEIGRTCVACFLFNEGSGKRVTDSAYGLNFLITGSPKFGSQLTEPGLNFTQSDSQYIDLGTPTNFNFGDLDSFSVEDIFTLTQTTPNNMELLSQDNITGDQKIHFFFSSGFLYRWTALQGPTTGVGVGRQHILYTFQNTSSNNGIEKIYSNGKFSA